MTVTEWSNLSPREKSERWTTLTPAERDAVLETDKTVSRELLATGRATTTPAISRPGTSEALASVVVTEPPTRTPVLPPQPPATNTAHVLAEVRAHSCYNALRSLIGALAILGYLSALVFLFIGIVSSGEGIRGGAPASVYFLSAIAAIIVATAGKQSALLLVDLVDLHLLNEAKRRAENRQA
jgi:hypothetical protein